ncbi:MAG: sodium/proline symporter [Lachnospiraceae bacterium]|nr:sodium/proline symporter [Lachnospiraceae bacterium]
MTSATIGIIATIVIYLGIMIAIGFFFGKKGDSSAEGFYLGGRKLGPLVAAMSAEASDMSSWLLMGLPGVAYICGIADAAWTAIGLAVGTYLNWLFVAKKLRRYSVKLNAITVPEYFSKRFHDEKNVLSLIAALVIVIFFVPYTASGFKAVGTLVNSLFGVDYHVAMLVGAAIIVLYTVLGGFLAVSTTDLIQSIVMTIALAVMVFYGTHLAGGWSAVAENAQSLKGYLSLTAMHDIASGGSTEYSLLTICSTTAWGLGYFGMPHIILRFMAIRDEKEIKTSRRIASVWVVISMAVAIVIGVIGNAVSKAGTIPSFTDSSEAETVIIKLADLLSQNGFMAAIVAGLVLAGILACTMSTADSQLLTAGSAISKNLFQDFFKVKMSDKTAMIIARGVIGIVAVAAVILAWNPSSSVFKIVSFAWAGFGGAFGAVVLFSLFWKRMNFAGALAGMVTGGAMVFFWKFVIRVQFADTILNIYELLPAFITSCVFIVVVSLISKKPSDAIIKEFDEVSAKPAKAGN